MNFRQKSYYISLILIFIVFSSIPLFPQSPVYKYFSVDNGLPSNEVYHVMQDSKGYIWFGTDNGVSRYDGYKFTNFSISDGLPDNAITYIYEDYKSRIWFLSLSRKLAYFYDDSIYAFKFNQKLIDFTDSRTNIFKLSFYVDTNDIVYLGTSSHGLVTIKPDGEIINILSKNSLQIHIIGDASLMCRRRQTGNAIVEIIDKDTRFYSSDILKKDIHKSWQYSVKSENKIFFNFSTYVLYIQDSMLNTVDLGEYVVWLSVDKFNDLWVGLYNGGVKCFKNSDINSTPNHYMKDQTVSSVLLDNENSLWLSTLNGIYYYPNKDIHTISMKDGISSNKINNLEVGQNNKLWFTTSNEFIYSFKNELEEFEIEKASFIHTIKWNYYYNSLCFGATYKTKYFEDRDYINYRRSNYNIKGISFHGWQGFRDIHCLNDEIYWVVYENIIKLKDDVLLFDCRSKFNNDDFHFKPLKILYINDSLVWIACKDGLRKFNGIEYENLGNKNKLFSYMINDIAEYNKDDIIIGTKGAGLLIMSNNNLVQIERNNGLSDNTVTSLYIDGDTIWAGTFNGLNKIIINGNKYSIQHINNLHGLTSGIIYDIVVINDTVFVATEKGLSYFNKNIDIYNKYAPPVYITKISINEKDTLLEDKYNLTYDLNSITIDYIGLNFKNIGKVTYQYNLSGIDHDWITTEINKVRYPSLKPGDYEFKVYAINEDGVRSEFPAKFNFRIYPPFWNTWWFYLSISLFLILIVLAIYLNRIRNIKKRENLLHEINKYRQKALSKQMNPHFIFNSLNSIQYFILNNDRKGSNKYLSKFSNLMRQTLENSRHDSIPIADEIDALTLYLELESLRFKEKFEYNITVDPEIDINRSKIPTLIIQPYIENAIWHGIMHKEGIGKVEIEIIRRNDCILCRIVDNGVGRKKSAEINAHKRKDHNSLGTSITESRLGLINSLYSFNSKVTFTDIYNCDNEIAGTKVEITLPHI